MNKTKRACVVIPIYKLEMTPYEAIALEQCFKILGHYQIFFAVPKRLGKEMALNSLVLSGQALYITFRDEFFTDIPGYNRLLKSTVFYQSFISYDYLLIYQLDAFVFKDELLKWCDQGYSNIGAPIFEGHELAAADSTIVGQGNGGFCLRNVKDCYHVVSSFRKLNYVKSYTDTNRSVLRRLYRYVKHDLLHNYSLYPFQPIINEDLFWSVLVPAVFPAFKVPEPAAAIGFSFEVNPRILYKINLHELPFGCHAWLRYDLGFWSAHINKFGYDISAI